MVKICPPFETTMKIDIVLVESPATIKPLSQAIGLHVVEILELGGWM